MRLNGARGQFLLSLGFIYLAIGLTYGLVKQPELAHAMKWMPSWATIQVCGVVWIVTGCIAMVMAFVPIPHDRFGFMALAGWSSAWAIAWAVAWGLGDSPVGFIGFLVYAAFASAALSVARMTNNVRRRVAETPEVLP